MRGIYSCLTPIVQHCAIGFEVILEYVMAVYKEEASWFEGELESKKGKNGTGEGFVDIKEGQSGTSAATSSEAFDGVNNWPIVNRPAQASFIVPL